MRRNLVCMMLLVMSLVLAACSSGGTDAATPGVATASAGDAALGQGALSPVAKNLLGIFRLEGTDLAVDSAQAAALLPLWQAYRSLINSDTTAPVELEALQEQISESLTAEQQDAIAAMNLTVQDMFAMAEELGVMQARASADGADAGGNRPSFEFGGGGPGGPEGPRFEGGGGMPAPGGGGGFVIGIEGAPPGEGGAFDPSMMPSGTPQAGQLIAGRPDDRFSLALLDPLIELLKERAGS